MTSSDLHYLVAVTNIDSRLTETVTAVSGKEVAKGLGQTDDAAEFGESVFQSLHDLFAAIDESAADLPAQPPNQLSLLPREPPRWLPAGARLRGNKGSYRVGALIGRGGTAEVCEATSETGYVCAAKLLSPHRFAITTEMQARFEREIVTLRSFHHDNIVRVVDVATYVEAPVLLMEFIADSLKDRLAKDARWDFLQLQLCAEGVLRALAALHAVGVVHRDVTPKNLLLRADGSAVLADFGTARKVLDATITHPEDEIGSLLYISQEQFENPHAAAPADDIYSLGRVLWEAAAGKRLLRILPPLQIQRPDLPSPFVDLVDEMLSEFPGDRPTSAEALARVENVREGSPLTRRPASRPGTATEDIISEEVAARLALSRQANEVLFDDVRDAPSTAVVRQALLRAEELGVISRRMPRVPLFDTSYVVRFVPAPSLTKRHSGNESQAGVRVVIEQPGGDVIESFDWSNQMSAVDLGEVIGLWLIETDRYPGAAAYQPGQMFHELRTILRRAYGRISGSTGIRIDLAPVIQLFGDVDDGDAWWITDAGVQRDGLTYAYTIEKSRFDELDWDEHVSGRSGVDVAAFRMALQTARELQRRDLL